MRAWMETTDSGTHLNYSRWGTWIRLRKDRELTEKDAVWVFSDGSSSGWHGATVVIPGKQIIRVCKFEETPNKNINPEINGAIAGIEKCPVGSTVYVVHDLFGIGPWFLGHWRINKPEVRDKIDKLHAAVAGRGIDVRFIHHGGHQDKKRKKKDKVRPVCNSEFTKWNCATDKMLEDKVEVDTTEILSEQTNAPQ